MKKTYIFVELDIIKLATDDIVTASLPGNEEDDNVTNLPDLPETPGFWG